MPRVQVKSLYELTLNVVKQNLQEDINIHKIQCAICYQPRLIEKCVEMVKVKEQFHNLPSTVINNIYVNLEKDCRGSYNEEIDFMFIYCFLLENPHLSVKLVFNQYEDNFFLKKYGKYVISIDFYRRNAFLQGRGRNNYFHDFFWKTVIYSSQNILVLDLTHFHANPEMLEHIGLECSQIKIIKGLDNMIKHDYLLASHFRKLCFRQYQNVEIKNKCCNTLQELHLSCSAVSVKYRILKISVLREIIPILLENITNLKYLGNNFHIDYYLFSVVSNAQILETNLEKIHINEGKPEILPLLQKFCPRMTTLFASHTFDKGFTNLHDYFPNLETLNIRFIQEYEQILVYKIITSSIWSKLTKVTIRSKNLHIELSDFAKNLPTLQCLRIAGCKINWNGKTRFRFLNKVIFEFSQVQTISWISPFAQTIEELQLSMLNYGENLNKEICSPLLTIPLPKLELLGLYDLEYDFDFITGIICVCPSLTTFLLFRLDREGFLDDVYKFVKDNNYNCKFDLDA